MIEQNEAILRRWVNEVWNEGREETIEELFSETGAAICPINPPENPVRGVDGFKEFFRFTKRLFFDIEMTVEDAVTEGEKVTALCNFTARRHKNEADGTKSVVAVSVSGLCQIKVRDGKIYHAWNNIDLVNAW